MKSTAIIDGKLHGLFFLISLDFKFTAVKINESGTTTKTDQKNNYFFPCISKLC